MTLADPRRVAPPPPRHTVVLRSRGGQQVSVSDDLDRAFLEMADDFLLRTAEIKRDPSRRRPRLDRA